MKREKGEKGDEGKKGDDGRNLYRGDFDQNCDDDYQVGDIIYILENGKRKYYRFANLPTNNITPYA